MDPRRSGRLSFLALVLAVIGLVFSWYQTSTVSKSASTLQAQLDVQKTILEKSYGVDLSKLTDAIKEGKLVYYSGAGLDRTMLYVEEFKKRYPMIDVEVYRTGSDQLHEKYVSEVKANKFLADIVIHGQPGLIKQAVDQGLLTEYQMPNNDPHYPDSLKFKNYAYPLFVYYGGIVYNSNLVKGEDEKQLAASWKAVLDPKWKGKVAGTTPDSGGTSYGPNYMFLSTNRNDFGPDFLKAFQAQGPKYYTSQIPATQQVASGEHAIHAWGNSSTAGGLIVKDAPIKIVYPEPTPAIPMIGGIAKNPPHPATAKLFMDWAFSKDGQEAAVRAFAADVVRDDVKMNPLPNAAWYKPPTKIVPIDWMDFDKKQADIYKEWYAITGFGKN